MKTLAALLLTIFITSAAHGAGDGWTTDIRAAFAKAKKENKKILVEFTGSDWCKPCIEMKKNVFSKKSFTSKASEKFILVELDFPTGNEALSRKNEPYAEKLGVNAFPTVILFNSDGKEYNRFLAQSYPTVDKFLTHLATAK